ncbi:undecaprenyl-diphosphate phosphatase [bacterium endosymbiont of Pedicinus badii]|uniref:undecaprenyl-diphosphate phosphatase n=1 Tax=bacterium endosymbiont of Pedicinus badii TaxID=1719126 RepID=UPI0009BC6D61|nr:undecaprenyl-diphosphate phosphatase [bacterium endosymbiont of Pedicinus badii]OQM34161.1 hypothetical protein AOQ89_02370 [bacterium endosymbiont of Pedicinus badii]
MKQDFLFYFFAGIISGITEFFPISSTVHVSIFSKIFKNISYETIDLLNSFAQLGSAIIVIKKFKSYYFKICNFFLRFLYRKILKILIYIKFF